MSEARYVVRPRADRDLEEQALFYAIEANPELGHRFLIAARETFSLLATQPEMGWMPKLRDPDLTSLRIFRVSGFPRSLVLYRAPEGPIEILRVIHGSRNVERFLRRLEP